VARTFPLLIQTVRVEATQELSDVILKVHGKFEDKFPDAALVVDIKD
jgi:hypothetical protein